VNVKKFRIKDMFTSALIWTHKEDIEQMNDNVMQLAEYWNGK
jgi:hypothetical protein